MPVLIILWCAGAWVVLAETGTDHQRHQARTAAKAVLSAEGISPTLPPNEVGQILVAMYHRIGKKERTWTRTQENFKSDLVELYKEGYRPVSLLDYVENRVSIPAGTTPVVLTFDDGRIDNFRIIEENGAPTVDPTSAVGILEQFHAEHPDFPLEATFFLHGKVPFGQSKWISYKLNYLVAKGMDVGNHTTGHDNLSLSQYSRPERIQRVIGEQAQYLEKMLTEHPTYRVAALALCHGQRPRHRALWRFLSAGLTNGYAYANAAVLNVGSGPAPAPASTAFNPHSVPRVRASEIGTGRLGLRAWLRYFDRYPNRRYISDGDVKTLTVPLHLKEMIDKTKLNKAQVVYSNSEP
ncbi:MAG: polysaccharide deacetylase family protein [Myxococcota bacterium]|nr:polysaccharide deacetylase family protein [Myxococcota bacterium]